MHYANPDYFPFLISSITALLLFYFWAMARKRRLAERFAERGLLNNIASSVSYGKNLFKVAITAAAVSLALFALVRPQWGFQWEEAKRTGLDILIAIDVSKSMLATDVRPNRLERSKFAVKDMMRRLNGDRIGLIAFAGTAFLQCPLTIDYNGFMLSLDDLNPGTIPRAGTSIAAAIREAINVFKGADTKYKVLVIITDGEELEDSALAAAKEASGLGIKIYCVGVGTGEGELIPVIDETGNRAYLADREGRAVKTKLDEELLKQVAISTGGNYVRATQSEFGLELLYDTSISKLERRDIDSKMRKSYHERYQYFLSFALLLLLIGPLISGRKRAP